jgi:hypothetical protein
MESAVGRAACQRVGARTSQPRHASGGPETRCLPVGRRQKRSALPTTSALGGADPHSSLRNISFELTGDRRPFLANSGIGRGVTTPDARYRLYRGRPENPNSYFVDRARTRFPPWCDTRPRSSRTSTRAHKHHHCRSPICSPPAGLHEGAQTKPGRCETRALLKPMNASSTASDEMQGRHFHSSVSGSTAW